MGIILFWFILLNPKPPCYAALTISAMSILL